MNTTCASHRGLQIGTEAEPALACVARHQLFQSRLENRHPPGAQPRDLGLILVDARHVVSEIGKAGARHQAHIA
jgi:hypothetical protein